MKKIILICLVIPIIMINILNNKSVNGEEEIKEEFRGIYISYIEISKYLKDKSESVSKENIVKMIENVQDLGCNTIILQVRPSSDAIYNSNTFPLSKYLTDNGEYPYDVLEFFIEETHKRNMDIIAWINPYRVCTSSTTECIEENNPAYKYIGTDIIHIENGIYYNPSKKEVNDLIIKGVEELLNYNIEGILFDDYFYPCEEIDEDDYNEYIKNNPKISKKEYHLQIVSNMVKEVHKKCSEKNVEFGISPDGNIDNNYNKHFADVKKWVEEDGYVDFIMPQVYYGFNNSNRPFYKTIKEWNNCIKNNNIKLYIALAFYKVGNKDSYAAQGEDEWIEEENIIMKEIIAARNLSHYDGFALYRYESIFNNDKAKEELTNVKKILK